MLSPLKKRSYFLLLVFLVNGLVAQTAQARGIIIRGKIPVYIDPNELVPVRRAVKDLLRDLNTVFGQPSALLGEIPKTGSVIIIATGDRYKRGQPLFNSWEAHQVYAAGDRITLDGADMQGTICAGYDNQ